MLCFSFLVVPRHHNGVDGSCLDIQSYESTRRSQKYGRSSRPQDTGQGQARLEATGQLYYGE